MDKLFTATNHVVYTISLSDFGDEISVSLNGIKQGSILLSAIEYPDNNTVYRIINLSLEKCRGVGIGRECLKFHKSVFDSPISAGESNGLRSDDGSHLTGDGVGFIAKMRKEGVVEDETDGDLVDGDEFL